VTVDEDFSVRRQAGEPFADGKIGGGTALAAAQGAAA
jgi:hypothetical protein